MHWLHDSGDHDSDSHSAMIKYNLGKSFLFSFLIFVSSLSQQEQMICKRSFKKWRIMSTRINLFYQEFHWILTYQPTNIL